MLHFDPSTAAAAEATRVLAVAELGAIAPRPVDAQRRTAERRGQPQGEPRQKGRVEVPRRGGRRVAAVAGFRRPPEAALDHDLASHRSHALTVRSRHRLGSREHGATQRAPWFLALERSGKLYVPWNRTRNGNESWVEVELRGLSIYTHHGVSEAEREIGQRLEFDVSFDVPDCDAVLTDRIEDTVDYGEVCDIVALAATERSYKTLERLVPGGRRAARRALRLRVGAGAGVEARAAAAAGDPGGRGRGHARRSGEDDDEEPTDGEEA